VKQNSAIKKAQKMIAGRRADDGGHAKAIYKMLKLLKAKKV
jgi:hypothetical protein